eukprot:TRINITY_DN71571_c0_g1_i1.p1 TRINITY_DN71571_c0_g1~~TRINITY_DN71571_c0_g1_i1.p1  ORF type:complete len:233 (+),score=7.15 TRINITY_DN71571_c0_g1_i1:78-776(+)
MEETTRLPWAGQRLINGHTRVLAEINASVVQIIRRPAVYRLARRACVPCPYARMTSHRPLLRTTTRTLMYRARLTNATHSRAKQARISLIIVMLAGLITAPFWWQTAADSMAFRWWFSKGGSAFEKERSRGISERQQIVDEKRRSGDLTGVKHWAGNQQGTTSLPSQHVADHAVDCYNLWLCLRRVNGDWRACRDEGFGRELDWCTRQLNLRREAPSWERMKMVDPDRLARK